MIESVGHGLGSTELTCAIVAAYVANNSVPVSGLPDLIRDVHSAISGLASASLYRARKIDKPDAAQIRKSVRREGIVSFIDGKPYKILKRHLTANGMDPSTYRERYGLPADYPMVAPIYAQQRSALAKAIGLGVPGAMAESTLKGRRKAA